MKLANVMNNTLAYRLWMAPFADKKLAPMLAHNDLSRARRVLDVGCGPGTNTPVFRDQEYLGIDWNPGYIESARRRHRRDFLVADVTQYVIPPEQRYDFILANSLFHHIDEANTRRILAHLATLLTPDGFVHVIDLILPPRASIPRVLAKADRGDFPRPVEEWRRIFSESFDLEVFEPFPVGVGPLAIWEMIYVKGRAKR